MSRVRTEYGVVEGVESDGLHLFRNVPFAAAPFGMRRFRPPVAPEPWDGVRDGTTGEDCLTVEVCTPDPVAAGLPVMVHIHGGAYVFGAGSAPGYRGQTFARHGIVHVGINYRLGIEGFLYLGDGADNTTGRTQSARPGDRRGPPRRPDRTDGGGDGIALARFGRNIVVGDARALLLSPFRAVHGPGHFRSLLDSSRKPLGRQRFRC